uniref:Uncharacterized protein n=1 Tax=Anguilla anguilla TaxID=7936 RepID=A0A0E9VJK4_ANGAN
MLLQYNLFSSLSFNNHPMLEH